MLTQVIRRYKTGSMSSQVWDLAVQALKEFQEASKKLRSVKPSDPDWEAYAKQALFLPTPLAPHLSEEFSYWASAALGPKALEELEALRPKGYVITTAEDPDAGYALYLQQLDLYEQALQGYLNDLAPAQFSYAGFVVFNPNRLNRPRALAMLDGVDFLLALFKRRGIEPLLREGVKYLLLDYNLGNARWHGYYASQKQMIALSTIMLGHGPRLWTDWVQEVFLHEFGHHVHLTYIKGEAKEYWDSTWQPVEELQRKLQKVTVQEIERFYAMLEKDDFQPAKTAKRLQGVDRLKFAFWLRNPLVGEPIITPAQFRLTKRGEQIFQIMRDPATYVREVSSIPSLSEEENIKRTLNHRKRNVLGVGFDFPISAKEVEDIRKADPTIDAELEKVYAELGVPTDYGRTNEKEDFAETFVAFVTNPGVLSENALFRMKRTLWLSSFGGKPVLRLAQKVMRRYLREE